MILPPDFSRPEDFYSVYDRHRTYVRAEVRAKHLREFGRNLWRPGEFQPGHRVLELGCGVGLFLAYLERMGVKEFVGVEMDAKARDFMPPSIAERVVTSSFEAYFDLPAGRPFDRIVLLDVFEHFDPGEGVALLRRLAQRLRPGGQVLLRVPNMASPWGLQYQYNDLTHKGFYAPGNLGQLALAAGYECVATLPYGRGSAVRRFTTRLVEGALNRLLTDPPPVWTANFVAVLQPNP